MVENFFKSQTPASALKSGIVVKYILAWGTVVAPSAGDHLVYFEPFCGKGKYDDGSESTPLLVLRAAASHRQLRRKLITIFRDIEEEHCRVLKQHIADLPEARRLGHYPVVICEEVDSALARHFATTPLSPTFAFLDPIGFKGVSLELVDSLIKDWGCDCLFFFNYNEVNRWLRAPGVAPHIDALFREARAEALRSVVSGISSVRRESLVLDALRAGVLDGPADYVQTFRFMNPSGSRTSHYLVFATKSFKGYEIMRDVMAKASSYTQDGVPTYVYTSKPPAPSLLDRLVLEDLKDDLAARFAGQDVTVRQVFETHSVGKRFVLPNYKWALRELESGGRVAATPPAEMRRKNTLADETRIRFPR
jgi:three-Cys-motif partner protein